MAALYLRGRIRYFVIRSTNIPILTRHMHTYSNIKSTKLL
jgi:hypothetical protein